jgi:hypothetical protein
MGKTPKFVGRYKLRTLVLCRTKTTILFPSLVIVSSTIISFASGELKEDKRQPSSQTVRFEASPTKGWMLQASLSKRCDISVITVVLTLRVTAGIDDLCWLVTSAGWLKFVKKKIPAGVSESSFVQMRRRGKK